MNDMGLSSNMEDYLEAIYHIVNEKSSARVKDIASRINVKYSSVTGALQYLAEKKLVNYAPYEHVTLTEQGLGIALDVVRRHEALRDFFIKVLAIDEETADIAACRMEHGMPEEIMIKFYKYIEYVETCPQGGAEWMESGEFRCQDPVKNESCSKCGSTIITESDIKGNRDK